MLYEGEVTRRRSLKKKHPRVSQKATGLEIKKPCCFVGRINTLSFGVFVVFRNLLFFREIVVVDQDSVVEISRIFMS